MFVTQARVMYNINCMGINKLSQNFRTLLTFTLIASTTVLSGYYIRAAYGQKLLMYANVANSNIHTFQTDKKNPYLDQLYFEVTSWLTNMFVQNFTMDNEKTMAGIEGMIKKLHDPYANFYNPEEYQVWLDKLNGVYEGINCSFKLSLPTNINQSVQIYPNLSIEEVWNSNASEPYNLKRDDIITELDGKWILCGENINTIFNKYINNNDNKLNTEKYHVIQKELDHKINNSISINKAIKELAKGTSGKTKLSLIRGNKFIKDISIKKQKLKIPSLTNTSSNYVKLNIQHNIQKILQEKKDMFQESKVIDLRKNYNREFSNLKPLLSLFLPKGDYGYVLNKSSGIQQVTNKPKDNSKRKKLSLIVDNSTQGVARAFAIAAIKSNYAKLAPESSYVQNKDDITQSLLNDTITLISNYSLKLGYGYSLPTQIYSWNKNNLAAESKQENK